MGIGLILEEGSKMGKAFLKELPRIYSSFTQYLDEDIAKIRMDGLPIGVGYFFVSRALRLRTLAICEYLINQNIGLMKIKMYNAALCGLRSIEWFDEKKDELNVSNSLSLSTSRYLEFALISENIELIKEVAKKLGGRGALDSKDIGNEALYSGYALKYIVMNDYSKALEYIEKLHAMKKLAKYNLNEGNALLGIINGDSEQVNTALVIMLAEHKKFRSYSNTEEEFICIRVLAFSKLAISKGILITIDEDLAPREIIDPTEGLVYELVVFLKYQ